MRGKIFAVIGLCFFIACSAIPVFAQDAGDEAMTLEMVKQKVEKAAQLIAAEGESAFPKLKDKTGEFWFGGGKGYIWVHNLEGNMLVHPAQPELEGIDALGLKDSSGFPFIVAMNDLVKKYGSGWVVYFWSKPGKKITDFKASYVKLVRKDGRNYVVGCGMYNVNKEFVQSVFPGDQIVTNGQ